MIENVLQKFGGVGGHPLMDHLPFEHAPSLTSKSTKTRQLSPRRPIEIIDVNQWIDLQMCSSVQAQMGTSPQEQIISIIVDSISKHLITAAVSNSVPILHSYTGHECAIENELLVPCIDYYLRRSSNPISIFSWNMWNMISFHMSADWLLDQNLKRHTTSSEYLTHVGSRYGYNIYENRHAEEHGLVLDHGWFSYSITEPLRFLEKYRPEQNSVIMGLVGKVSVSFDPKKIRRITTI